MLTWDAFLLPTAFAVFSLFPIFLHRATFSQLMGKIQSLFERNIIFLFFICLLLLLLNGRVWDALAAYAGMDDTQRVAQSAAEIALVPLLGILFILFSAGAEEMLFRGTLQNYMGLMGSAVLFALLHVGYGSIAEVLGALGAGIILGIVRERGKSIFPGMLAHALYNLFIVFALLPF